MAIEQGSLVTNYNCISSTAQGVKPSVNMKQHIKWLKRLERRLTRLTEECERLDADIKRLPMKPEKLRKKMKGSN
jgi:predicted RNase H-like nuclease (RuvC/YqgF family)